MNFEEKAKFIAATILSGRIANGQDINAAAFSGGNYKLTIFEPLMLYFDQFTSSTGIEKFAAVIPWMYVAMVHFYEKGEPIHDEIIDQAEEHQKKKRAGASYRKMPDGKKKEFYQVLMHNGMIFDRPEDFYDIFFKGT